MYKRTCTGPIVTPAPKRRRTASAVPEFTVRRKKRALGDTSEMYEVDMKESDNLTALQGAVTSFQLSMSLCTVVKMLPINLFVIYRKKQSSCATSILPHLRQ